MKNMERSRAIVTGKLLSSFLALILTMMYLNHSCIAKSLPSISPEKNSLVANSLSLLQNREYEKDNLFCLTPGCVKAAASLINSMDQSVDPCDDFYQFACGNFIKNRFIVDDSYTVQTMTAVSDSILYRQKMLVSEPIQPDEQRPFKMIKLLFKSCMDQDQIEKIGLGPIKEILKRVGGWPVLEADKWNESKFTLMDTMHKLIVPNQKNMNYLFQLAIDQNLTDTKTNVVYLLYASFGLELKHLVQGKDYKFVESYYRYMVDIAVLFGADRQRATEELRESLDFEIELAKIQWSLDKREISIKMLKPIKLVDLQQHFPSIPWQEFLNKLLNQFIRQDFVINANSLEYFSGLETLLRKTSKRVLANYMIWRYVNDSLKYLTKELRKRQAMYMEKEVTQPRWKECVDISTELFNVAIGSMYVRRFFDENTKQNALEIINGIKEEMYKILSSNEWMDDETRKKAMDKAKMMKYFAAYPDELLDDRKLNAYYENLAVNDQDFYTSVLNVSKFCTDNERSTLWKPAEVWIDESEIVVMMNALYKCTDNKIYVPAGMLHSILFSNDRPQYMNYGTIGYIAAHEITHGFDNTGISYDMHGNLVGWLVEETYKRFMEKAECFINQYGNYTIDGVGNLNGTLTLGENISDNGASYLAYYAYEEWVKAHGVEPRLPGLQDYTPQQIFWLTTANTWCAKSTKQYDKFTIAEDVHSPNRYRIIGSFSNNKEFSDDFQCPLGSKMNPAKKCQMW